MQSQTGHCLPQRLHRALFKHIPSSNPLWDLRKDSICFARRIPLPQEKQMGSVQTEPEGKGRLLKPNRIPTECERSQRTLSLTRCGFLNDAINAQKTSFWQFPSAF